MDSIVGAPASLVYRYRYFALVAKSWWAAQMVKSALAVSRLTYILVEGDIRHNGRREDATVEE